MSPANARFELGERLGRAAHARPYDPRDTREARRPAGLPPPAHRLLAIYTQDPATSRHDASVAVVPVPFEPLAAGPAGAVLRVVDENRTTRQRYEPVDLDRLGPGYPTGLRPTTTNPQFAQQMVYAVCMRTYDRVRRALGRTPDFAFEPHPDDASDPPRVRLTVLPHAMEEDNAYYDRDAGELVFGYLRAAADAPGLMQPGALVFTALSHDVVAHEMTHALLDGMRANFLLPTNPDVDAFHEAFADLVALFQRFVFRDLVKRGIELAEGGLTSRLLTDIARQFGQASEGGSSPLRTALLADANPDKPVTAEFRYRRSRDPHDLGAVLVAAVFDAFRWVFNRKTAALRQLAPASGGRLQGPLIDQLAGHAERLAGQFLDIVIRAVDYCPPVDLTFGEYLRALITADHDIVPDDPWGYREALVQAFRRYGVTVEGVADLSEDALLWRPPDVRMEDVAGLAFGDLRHGREPGQPAGADEVRRRATVLGEFVTKPAFLHSFGLAPGGAMRGSAVRLPVVESVRTLRRIGPDGDINFDLVAEVSQRRKTTSGRWMHGGSTIVLDAGGRVRYAVCKHVRSASREARLAEYLDGASPLQQRCFTDDPPSARERLRALHRRTREERAG